MSEIQASAVPARGATARTVQAGDHYVGFWAHVDLGGGSSAFKVFRAAHLDTDGDGLLDHWERLGGGIDIDQDGTIDLDLKSMGADPLHKDIFLEIDWLADQANHRQSFDRFADSRESDAELGCKMWMGGQSVTRQILAKSYRLLDALDQGVG